MKKHFYQYTLEEIESKLFNGNVLDPIPLVLFPAFIIIIWSFFSIWITLNTVIRPYDHEILESKCVIVSLKKNNDNIILENEFGELFALNEDLISVNTFSDLYVGKEPLRIEYDGRRADSPYDVISVSRYDGVPIIAKDTIKKNLIKDSVLGLIVVWALFCFQITFFGSSMYILNNAKKYPQLASLIIRSTHRKF